MRITVPRIIMALACVALLAMPAFGSSGGPPVSNGVDPTVEFGCTCHGGGTPSVAVIVSISGVPQAYTSGETYNFTISLQHQSNSIGGFLMTDFGNGSFTPLEEEHTRVAEDNPNAISHSEPGNDWLVPWTAPASDIGAIHFSLVGNAVNGDGIFDEGDNWNILTFSIASPNGATVSEGEELSLRTISVGDYDELFKQEVDPEAVKAAEQKELADSFFAQGNLYYWTTFSILLIAAVFQGEFYQRKFAGGPDNLDMRLAVPQAIRRGLLFVVLSYFFFWTLENSKPWGWNLLVGMLALWAGYGLYRTYAQAKAPLKVEQML
jgi:hypothetical protein